MKKIVLGTVIICLITSSSQAIQHLKPERSPEPTKTEDIWKKTDPHPPATPLKTAPTSAEPISTPTGTMPSRIPMELPEDNSGKTLHERVADFVVAHNQELKKIKEGAKMLENIKFDVGGKYAQQTYSAREDDQRWEVMFNLTLVDKRSLREQELLGIQTERKIRQEIIALVDQYVNTKNAVERAKKNIGIFSKYIAWMEKRVQAGVEYAKDYYGLLIKSGSVEKNTEQTKSLTYIAEMICSYVPKDNCYEIKKMLGADKIGADETNVLLEDKKLEEMLNEKYKD